MKIDVNPKMLIWAREEAGMSIKDVTDKLKLQISDLTQWELDGREIFFATLELIARLYKRQTAIFFLSNEPARLKKPKDCRNLAVDNGNFSPETMLAIRRTERYLHTARELLGETYWNKQYEWLKKFNGKTENINKEILLLKELLELNDSTKSRQKSDIVFKNWRTKIEEKLGIFVFQFPMSGNELDGFSYAFDNFPYAIVVNKQNASVRKIFTIFHELFHILKHNPGACKPDYSINQLNIEFECNTFAGKFLVPKEYLNSTNSVDEIFKLARSLNISGEVYLRRLFEENKISKNSFFQLLNIVKERSNRFSREKKKLKGFPSRTIISKSTRGNKFFNMIMDATISNKISYSSASDLLGLKVCNIRL
ncbi:ImmA/IrrE family metallo-endopeptidase [Candidatus Peregrinibacteria bacterium]|nr:ImmA/IrrE family metallo-endopeptidase [Candidatus Peregrinibacteria bacterium]